MILEKMKSEIQDFIDFMSLEKGLSDLSCQSYKSDIEKYCIYLEKMGRPIAQSGQVDISRFLDHLRETGMAPSSISRNLSSLKGFYKFLHRNGEIKNNPIELISGPKMMRPNPGALKIDEILEILNSAKRAADVDNTKKKLSLRDLALLEFLYGTGARVSEASDAKFSDLYTEMKLVKLLGKGKKERVVPMGTAAWSALENYLEFCRPKIIGLNSADIIFLNNRGGKISRMGIWKIINKYVNAAGIAKKVSPHTFRHSFATHLLAGGADLIAVQELLGHADITTTEIYTHLDKDFLVSEHREFHPREKW